MVQIDFLAANHVRIIGLCGQNWNRSSFGHDYWPRKV